MSTVACAPSSVAINQGTLCVVTVDDIDGAGIKSSPSSDVDFNRSGAGTGTFSSASCTLAPTDIDSSACQVGYRPTSGAGNHVVTGAYQGSGVHETTSGNTPVAVHERSTSTSVTCVSPVVLNQASNCTVTVTDVDAGQKIDPSGSVDFSHPGAGTGTFSSASCPLVGDGNVLTFTSSCPVTYTPTSGSGFHTVRADYNEASSPLHAATGFGTALVNPRPTVGINQAGTQADPTNTSPIHFTAAFSEPVTGFDPSDISYAGSTAGGTVAVITDSGDQTTFDVAVSGMTGDGLVVASIPTGGAFDAQGDSNVASTGTDNAVTYDTTAPTGTITINGNATYTNSTTVPLNLNATDSSGIVSYRVAEASDCSSATFVAAFAAVSPYNANPSFILSVGDGSKTVCVQYKDAAGNISSNATDSIILDTTVPTGSITINSNATYTNSTTVTLNLNAADLNGIVSYRVANGAVCTSATFVGPFPAANPYSASISHTIPAGDGAKSVCVQFKDAAGNISTTYVDSIILDQTAPTTVITFPGTSGYTALAWNSGCLTPFAGDFCGTAADGLSGVAQVQYSIQRVTDNTFWNGTSFSSSPEMFFSPTGLTSWIQGFAFGNFPATGLYTIKARATDVAGNTSAGTQTSFTISNPSGGIYVFEGFFSPVDNPPILNKANAGQTIPIKWRITLNGMPVSDPNSFVALTSSQANCTSMADLPGDDIETYSTNAGLLYNGNGNWHFNWQTPKSYAGHCRIMTLTLNDGSTHDADFRFK
jgi:hypothetical protein